MADFATVVRRQLLHAVEPPQRKTEYQVISLRCSKLLNNQSEYEKPDHNVLQQVFSIKADININGALEVFDQVQACKPMYIHRFGHKTGNNSSWGRDVKSGAGHNIQETYNKKHIR